MGVEVMDRDRVWRTGTGGGGASAPHNQYRRDDDRSIPVDEANVTRILAQRTTAKMSRDFNTADALREELRGMGVEVNDQERTWKMRGAGPGGGGYGGGGGAPQGGGGAYGAGGGYALQPPSYAGGGGGGGGDHGRRGGGGGYGGGGGGYGGAAGGGGGGGGGGRGRRSNTEEDFGDFSAAFSGRSRSRSPPRRDDERRASRFN